MKKVVVIIDALKANKIDLIQKVINLKNFNAVEVIPPFSFEPDASFLCGKYPQDTDRGLAYWYSPRDTKNIVIKSLGIIHYYPRLLRKIINRGLLKIKDLDRYQGKFGSIPFKYLPWFELSSHENLFEADVEFRYQTIFNIMKKNNHEYLYLGVPHTSGTLHYIKEKLQEQDLMKYDTLFFFISDLDNIGHKYGGDSKEYDLRLMEILKFVNGIGTIFSKNKIPHSFMIFGDHGMVDVKKVIDIEKILEGLGLETGKDYIFFLDSTMARFWFINQDARDIIFNSIPNSHLGGWISDEDKNNYHINYSHNKFGDAIWWANAGTIISPNFWQGKRRIKGMHGYRNNVRENHTCLITDERPESNYGNIINMIEIHKILKKHLEIN